MSAKSNTLPPLLTIPEVAGYLRLSIKTVRRLIASGALPAHRVGRMLRVTEPDVRGYLRRN
jgi:excisionase family DNA binding protein